MQYQGIVTRYDKLKRNDESTLTWGNLVNVPNESDDSLAKI